MQLRSDGSWCTRHRSLALHEALSPGASFPKVQKPGRWLTCVEVFRRGRKVLIFFFLRWLMHHPHHWCHLWQATQNQLLYGTCCQAKHSVTLAAWVVHSTLCQFLQVDHLLPVLWHSQFQRHVPLRKNFHPLMHGLHTKFHTHEEASCNIKKQQNASQIMTTHLRKICKPYHQDSSRFNVMWKQNITKQWNHLLSLINKQRITFFVFPLKNTDEAYDPPC